jgi:hypothetical protein
MPFVSTGRKPIVLRVGPTPSIFQTTQDPPMHRMHEHASLKDAEAEAERLALKAHAEFIVYVPVSSWRAPKAVTETRLADVRVRAEV